MVVVVVVLKVASSNVINLTAMVFSKAFEMKCVLQE